MKLVVIKPSKSFRVLVSKKVVSGAVKRNLIKRRIREAVRAVHMFPTDPPHITVIALPPIVGKSFHEIKSEVEQGIKLL